MTDSILNKNDWIKCKYNIKVLDTYNNKLTGYFLKNIAYALYNDNYNSYITKLGDENFLYESKNNEINSFYDFFITANMNYFDIDYFFNNNTICLSLVLDRYYVHGLQNKVKVKNYLCLWASERDCNYAKLYIEGANHAFLPHAASIIDNKSEVFNNKRCIDVLISSNYHENVYKNAAINHKNFDIINKILNIYYYSANELEKVIKEYFFYNDEQMLEFIFDYGNYIDLTTRFAHKYSVINKLIINNIYVHCHGRYWQKSDIFHNEFFINYPYKPTAEAHKEFNNAKIVINPMIPSFDGSHERVFEAMTRGALCITTPSDFLRQIFIEDEEIVFYDPLNLDTLVEKVNYYLTHEDERLRITHNAYKNAIKNHTWAQRSQELVKIYEDYMVKKA